MADRDSAVVHLYDARSGSDDPISSSSDVHRSPVVAMRYNEPHDTVISTDGKGGCTGIMLLRRRRVSK